MNVFHSMARAARLFDRGRADRLSRGGMQTARRRLPRQAARRGTKPLSIATAPAASTDAYVSVFEDLLPPKGRDPFFPDSHRREPAPPPVVVAAAHKAAVASDLLLKGIVGSATHRLAVVNSQILEVGEEAPVRLPSGQVRVKCVEIGEDYAIVQVEGEARPQRLEMEKK